MRQESRFSIPLTKATLRAVVGTILVTLNLFLSAPLQGSIARLQDRSSDFFYDFGLGGFIRFFALDQPFPELRVWWVFGGNFVAESERSQKQANRLRTDLYPVLFYSSLRHPRWKKVFYQTMCHRLLDFWKAGPGDTIHLNSQVILMRWKNSEFYQDPQPIRDLFACSKSN